MKTSRWAEGSDAAVYPQLAQANLLRMRKRYKAAEDICLSILHQYPHNLSANTLMGDISVEEGNLEQAAEWYELALDSEPDSSAVQEKLDAVRSQKQEEVVASTAERLGLPSERPKTALITAICAAAIILVGVCAFLAYRASVRGSLGTAQTQIDKPLVIGSTGGAHGSGPVAPANLNSSTPVEGGLSEEDLALTKVLGASKDPNSAYLVDARYEPTVDGISITYNVPSDKSERAVGASLAADSFGLVKENFDKDIKEVLLRAIRDKTLYYSAIVAKDDYDATQSEDWQNAHKDDQNAFLNAVLTKEKYPSTPPGDQSSAASTGSNGTSATAGSTGASSAGTTGPSSSAGSTGASSSAGAGGASPTSGGSTAGSSSEGSTAGSTPGSTAGSTAGSTGQGSSTTGAAPQPPPNPPSETSGG